MTLCRKTKLAQARNELLTELFRGEEAPWNGRPIIPWSVGIGE
jgi:hypothetical protein